MLERELEPLDCPAEDDDDPPGLVLDDIPADDPGDPEDGEPAPALLPGVDVLWAKTVPESAIVAKNTTNFFILFLNPFVLDFESSRFHSAEALNNLFHLLWKKMGTPPQLI
jgi:hypothetical protein